MWHCYAEPMAVFRRDLPRSVTGIGTKALLSGWWRIFFTKMTPVMNSPWPRLNPMIFFQPFEIILRSLRGENNPGTLRIN